MINIPSQDEATILARVIAPDSGSLSGEAAEGILALTFPETDIARMDELAGKNRLGKATDSELAELELYSRVGNLLNLLHLKARRSLQHG